MPNGSVGGVVRDILRPRPSMGKRCVVMISSSSSEEDVESRDATRSVSASAPAARRRRSAKWARKGQGGSRSFDRSSLGDDKVNFGSLSDDFYECLNELHVLPGLRQKIAKELWVDNHKPHSLEELAVHKKKVGEIRKWIEDRVIMPKGKLQGNVLLITGQAGVGKSVVVNVLASQLGIEICEWKTPTPTIWQEHIHNSLPGIGYMSKLDEFENFVEHIRKYPVLPTMSTTGYRKPIILLIDDIPMTNGRVAYGRLRKCLRHLAYSAQVPTIILMTKCAKDEAGESTFRHLQELEACVEGAGACKVSLNPLTVNSIKKTLSRICREENCIISVDQIDMIAKSSGGDIRNAISNLQYFCLDKSCHIAETTDKNIYSSLSSIRTGGELESGFSLSFSKDETLSLFHALGKFLHNKRETVGASGKNPFLLHEQFARSPLKMDSPEKVLSQAYGQAQSIVDFLHENVLDFLSEEAITDAWVVASYLSDVDCLFSAGLHSSSTMTRKHEPDHVSQSVAASVAVRGVLFGNSQPSPSRWHSIRSPKLWQAEQSSRDNKNKIVMERYEAYASFSSNSISDIATEFMPTIKWLGYGDLADASSLGNSSQHEVEMVREYDDSGCQGIAKLNNNSFTFGETGDDEIEEW